MVVNRNKLFSEILNNFLDKFEYVEAIVISDVDGLKVEGKISTTKNPISIWNGPKVITENYILDNGQRGQEFDCSADVIGKNNVIGVSE